MIQEPILEFNKMKGIGAVLSPVAVSAEANLLL